MTPLITDGSMLESPYGDPTEGLNIGALCDGDPATFWHTNWHGGIPEEYHWIQVNFPEPISGNFVFYMLRRQVAINDHPTAIRIDSSNDGENWTTVVERLELPFNGIGTPTESNVWSMAEPASSLRLVIIDGVGAEQNFRKFWHAAEIQIYSAEGEALIAYQLNRVMTKYDGYLWGETLEIGNMPGQYSNAEAWEAFLADLNWVNAYLNGEITEEVTAEQIGEIAARMDANYQAVLDSLVPDTPFESGYYFVAAAFPYYKQDVKLDENGDTVFNAETLEPVYETVDVTKALFSQDNYLNWGTLDTNDCNFLFRIDHNPETGNYGFYACATEGRLNPIVKSTFVTLDPTLDPVASEAALVKMRIEESGREIIAISRADQNVGHSYLHEDGHASGAGHSGHTVGWAATAGASEWYLIPVEDADAQALIEAWIPIRDRGVMLENIATMVADGQSAMKIARDNTIELNEEYPLLTDASQLTSPYGDTVEGLNIEYLCDGNPSTHWHSNYHQVNAADPHWLQMTLNESLSGEFALLLTRRNAANDHPIAFKVEGSADGETWTHLGNIEIKYSGPGLLDKSTTWTMDESISVLRFTATNCIGASFGFRTFWHAAEFQAYPAQIIENTRSKMTMMGEVYTSLEAAIAAKEDDITVDHYTALEAAYDAFMAKFVDPAPLRTAVADAQENAATISVGTLPGYWNEGANADLTAAIATAVAYDKAGAYDAAKSEELIALLGTETTKFFAAANKVDTGKWYYIHMASEEMYIENEWPLSNVVEGNSGLGDLFGQYVTAGTIEQPEGDNNDFVTPLNGEGVREGSAMFFTDMPTEDGCLFRFIAVGDTAYVIQNKATGLYISCAAANSNDVTLSLNPTIFKPTAIGKGQLLFAGNSLAGVSTTNLHAQRTDHRLVTWGTNTLGSNSGLFVEEAEAVDFAALTNTFVRDVVPGKVYAQCWPVSISVDNGGMYTVAGTYTEGEKNFIALNEIEKSEAGVPFIFIHGTTADWTAPAEGEEPLTEAARFTGGNEVVAQADSINGLVGTFSTFAVEKGTTVFADNMAKATTAVSTNVAANGAFLRFGQTKVEAGGDYDLVLEIDGEVTVTAIESVLNNVAKADNVYDLNGRLVRTNATLNDVKALGRGMYILNGTKVLVK